MKSLADVFANNVMNGLDFQVRQDISIKKEWCIFFLALSFIGDIVNLYFSIYQGLAVIPFVVVEVVFISAAVLFNLQMKEWQRYLSQLRKEREVKSN